MASDEDKLWDDVYTTETPFKLQSAAIARLRKRLRELEERLQEIEKLLTVEQMQILARSKR